MALRCPYPTERTTRGSLWSLGLVSEPSTWGHVTGSGHIPDIGDSLYTHGWTIVALGIGSMGQRLTA